VRATPFQDLSSTDLNFFRTRATLTHYQPVLAHPKLTLAGRLSLGSIHGAATGEIPADKRFYAGGGGSIRGYTYQTVGPLLDGDPTGGRSVLEVSLESRIQIRKNLGLVLFLDGGNVYLDTMPDPEQDLLWGTGLGMRWVTPIGPLRLDVAFPLNRRAGIDDTFQVYVSIGQAF
jgi:translocation and assembly module TamA